MFFWCTITEPSFAIHKCFDAVAHVGSPVLPLRAGAILKIRSLVDRATPLEYLIQCKPSGRFGRIKLRFLNI